MLRIVVFSICALFISSAEAAKFKRLPASHGNGVPVAYIELEGPIEPGDVERLDKLIRNEDYDVLLSLNSNGGDFQTGIALAKYINTKPVATTVKGGNQCLSACAIAFLGGTSWEDEHSEWPSRSIEQTAKVGFHAPFLEIAGGQYDAERVTRAYDRAIRTIVQTIRAAPYMQVAAEDVAALMVAQREELFVLDTAERLARYGVHPAGLKMPQRFTMSMAISLCTLGWSLSSTDGFDLGIDGTNLFDLALDSIERSKWTASAASFRSTTPYGEDAWSIAIPIRPGAEGTITYCIVDRVSGDGKRIECRGYVRYEYLAEAVEDARGWGEAEIPCEMPKIVDPTLQGPEEDEASPYDRLSRNAWAFVPPRTPLSEIQETLEKFAATERDFPLP